MYDTDTLERLGEWPTHGIGPHDLLWHDDDVIAVANGGILTLPETGRSKRNLDTMEPSLALLDARDGRLLAAYTLADHRLSIRHLARTEDDTLGFALQYESDTFAPLLATLRSGVLRLADSSAELARRLNGYAASVAAWGDRFAVTCTRGDRIAVWDSRGCHRGEVEITKPAGITRYGDGWLVSNGYGELWKIDAETLRIAKYDRVPDRQWDNHLSAG